MARPDCDGQAGRPPAGQITTSTLADGTHAFRLRFQSGDRRERVTLHERRDCPCGCGGGWNERTARVELDNILAPWLGRDGRFRRPRVLLSGEGGSGESVVLLGASRVE